MERFKRLLALGALVVGLGGCAAPVFNDPITLSTRSTVERQITRLSEVRAEQTSYFFILLPFQPDPRDLYDDLLANARAAGGNAVVDVQIRSSHVFAWVLPGVVVNTIEAHGTAARIQ